MGAGEESTPTKPSKATSTQETQATPSYPDWSSMQAYYGAGATPPFFPSTVASPTPHPYMWGSQHPLMPPYGAPVPYPALYPPAGVYAHPNMPMTPNTLQTNGESDKAPDATGQNTSKKLKGCSGGKAGESGKAASGSGNDGGATRSAESGSEGSSDENDNHEFSGDKSKSFDLMLANGNPVAMPATNLNIGMDLWNAPSAGPGMIKMRSNQPGISPTPGIGREWIQDERELKRQKRKQSNRESARRSRLRKQAECEELQHKVETLSNENQGLKEELRKLSEECEKLTSENISIKDELTRLCGPEAVSMLESNTNTMHLQSNVEEANS